MTVDIENISDLDFSKELELIIENVIKKTIEIEAFPSNCEISVSIVNNSQIKQINDTHRNIDSETDVLSFPFIDYEKGEKPPKEGEFLLGDIVISVERVEEQAKEYNHSIEREIGFLTAHSMLHLLGYDHDNDKRELEMFHKQKIILDLLGLVR